MAIKLSRVTWEEFFQRFEGKNLALVYEEKTAGGNRSNFNKLVKRETVEARLHRKKPLSRAEKSRAATLAEGEKRTISLLS